MCRSCQASRISSTSEKYLYSVARPMPVSLAIRDIVTESGPCSATSAAVASSVASCTARRCASIVSFHNLGITPVYTTAPSKQYVLTITDCIDKLSCEAHRRVKPGKGGCHEESIPKVRDAARDGRRGRCCRAARPRRRGGAKGAGWDPRRRCRRLRQRGGKARARPAPPVHRRRCGGGSLGGRPGRRAGARGGLRAGPS